MDYSLQGYQPPPRLIRICVLGLDLTKSQSNLRFAALPTKHMTQTQFTAALSEEVAAAIRKLRKSGVSRAELSANLIIARINTRKLAAMPGAPAGTNAQWVFSDMVRKIANI